jgi:hypothetical protein
MNAANIVEAFEITKPARALDLTGMAHGWLKAFLAAPS